MDNGLYVAPSGGDICCQQLLISVIKIPLIPELFQTKISLGEEKRWLKVVFGIG